MMTDDVDPVDHSLSNAALLLDSSSNGQLNVASSSIHLRSSPLRSSIIKSSVSGSVSSRVRSPARKTVSFFSTTGNEKKISNVSDCLSAMQSGTELIKMRPNSRHFRRLFSLDADLSHIRWTPTNKKPHRARISIDSIREIRIGRNTEVLRDAMAESGNYDVQEECAFSIIYGDDYECLDLLATSADEANIWATGLMSLTSSITNRPDSSSTSMSTLRERWLASIFAESDADHKGYISEKTAVRLIRQLNNRLLVARIKHRVKEIAATKTDDEMRGRIGADEFIEIYKDLSTRPEVYFLMVRYANKDYLTCDDLQLFLETEQGMIGITKQLCQSIIEQYEPAPEARSHQFMTVDGFCNYLLGDECSIFDVSHRVVCQDMCKPFADYFISTSNNTYLIEDQLKGPSSVDGYVSALKRNCRFIEYVWEPTDTDADAHEPVIYQGGTQTSRLPIGRALTTIAEYAFVRTEYPLIIRLEQHLSIRLQKILAHQLRTLLAAYLYIPNETSSGATKMIVDWTSSDQLPTPHDFRNKILLTGKKLSTNCVDDVTADVSDEDESVIVGNRRRPHRCALCHELSVLMCPFLQSKSIKDLRTVNETLNYRQHLCNCNESQCLRIVQTSPHEFQSTVTRHFVTRVYPNSSRIDSSNLNPQEFWNYGVQLVALNYQTPGLMMDLQFAANGGCGYVLKPGIMRDDSALLHMGNDDSMPLSAPQILHLRILSGQQLPRPRGSTAKGDSADPFVVVEVFGACVDCCEERTKTVHNDNVNPSFDESFQFQISVPELALVRFLVLDDEFIGDDFIGQYTIPFECLQSGYRHIKLLNNEGDPLENCTLFVHIAITNRRGGGKARKRGASVKRKAQRTHTAIKAIGLKSIDELFKLASIPLAECIEMRNQLESAMIEWQEQCGLGATGSMRQGIRLLHSRVLMAAAAAANNTTISTPPISPQFTDDTRVVADSGDKASSSGSADPVLNFEIAIDHNGHPSVVIQGHMPEQLAKTCLSLETVLSKCRNILLRTDQLLQKLEESIKRISESYDELSSMNELFRGQKAIRAGENFAWNLRLLRTQLDLMSRTQREARIELQQVCDTASILGITTTSSNNSTVDQQQRQSPSSSIIMV